MRITFKILLLFLLIFFNDRWLLAQNNELQAITKGIEDYQSHHLSEKLFLHLDRSFYLNSETIWFKIYAVDASLHRPFDLSKVAYVELLDKENNSVLRAKVALEEGVGSGSLTIPSTINSGNYRLRAYTNWMKNFSQDYFFEQQITIVNGSRKLGIKSGPSTKVINADFFPEGGNLIWDLESRIAFKLTDGEGKGLDGQGYILNQDNDTISHFVSHKFGIGSFLFTPLRGNSYRALLTLSDGKTITKELPEIKDSGFVFRLTKETEDKLEFTVLSNTTQYVYLVGHSRGIPKIAEAKLLVDGRVSFTIEKSKMGDGINHFTLFDPNKRPVSERLYFKKPESFLQIELTKEKEVYSSREKIDLSILSKTEKGDTHASNLSLSVFLLDSLEKNDPTTILPYLWLSSDLKGVVESPEYYFENDDEESKIAMDNLMLTHGWSRFNWEDVLAENKPYFKFSPERRGQLVNARLIDKTTNTPTANIMAYLSVPGKKVDIFGGKSDSSGRVQFSLRELYGVNEVVVQTDFRKDSVYSIELFDSFSEHRPSIGISSLKIHQGNGHEITKRSINSQITENYWKEKNSIFRVPKVDSSFYVTPDKSYLLDNFVRFPTIEEVMREYVPEVNVRKKKGRYHFYVIDQPHTTVFQNDPLVLLDNIPVFDTDKLLAVNPLKIRKMEVLSRRYFIGLINSEGIVNFTTYDGKLGGFEIDPRALFIEFEGIQQQKEFYSPSYDTKQQAVSRIPDFRNLLLWNPSISIDERGLYKQSFFTSDVEGKYGVLVQGISKDGRAGSEFITFEVKKNVN